MENTTFTKGDILRSKENPKLRVKVLETWQPKNFPGETFISVQTVRKNNEPDKRFWKSWGGGSTLNWEKDI